MDGTRRLYLRSQDLSTVRYVVRGSGGLAASVRGDYKRSAQVLYAVYQDEDRRQQRTADYASQTEIDALGGAYRRVAVRPSGNLDAGNLDNYMQLELAEGDAPEVSTSFSVTGHVYTPAGKRVPVGELKAGGIVRLWDFRAAEAAASADDLRSQWTSFQLVGVEYDEQQQTARLIPAGPRRDLTQWLARVAGQEGSA
jgi:hypothetical protein